MSLQTARALYDRPLPPLSRWVLDVALTFVVWQMRRRMRHDFARLSPHLLSDVGLDPWFAQKEAEKPFWRP